MIDAPQRLRQFVAETALMMLGVAALAGALFVGGVWYGYELGVERMQREHDRARQVSDDPCWEERACCTLKRWPVETSSILRPDRDAAPRVRASEGSRLHTKPTLTRGRGPRRYAHASRHETSPARARASLLSPVSVSGPVSFDASGMWAVAPFKEQRNHYLITRQFVRRGVA